MLVLAAALPLDIHAQTEVWVQNNTTLEFRVRTTLHHNAENDRLLPQDAFEWVATTAPPGARNYWKSHNFVQFTDGMIENFIAYAESMPSPQSEIAIAQLGGAINRRPTDATAYPHRDAEFLMNLHTRWEDPAQDTECVAWARDLYDAMTPHATGGVYVNFIPEKVGQERAAYRENYDRLVELKNRYDPTNLFRLNQNIRPTASA